MVRKKRFTGTWKLILLEPLSGKTRQIFSRIYVLLFPMRIFLKSPIMRCMRVVGGLSLTYSFLMLLNHIFLAPPFLYTLFKFLKPSMSNYCRSFDSLFFYFFYSLPFMPSLLFFPLNVTGISSNLWFHSIFLYLS